MTKGINAANYLFWLHDLQPSIQETPQNRDAAPKAGASVDFQQLRFSYPLRPDAHILRAVDLEVSSRLPYSSASITIMPNTHT